MSDATRLVAGIILLTVPTIEYGGLFLLQVITGRGPAGVGQSPLQQSFFRAGHAHAGVIVILSLIAQVLMDSAILPVALAWLVRIGFPLSAVLMSAGFFLSSLDPKATQPNGMIRLLYVGGGLLALCVVVLGVGLVWPR